MAPTVESHDRRIILESDPYVGSWRRKQAEKGIDVLTMLKHVGLRKKEKRLDIFDSLLETLEARKLEKMVERWLRYDSMKALYGKR